MGFFTRHKRDNGKPQDTESGPEDEVDEEQYDYQQYQYQDQQYEYDQEVQYEDVTGEEALERVYALEGRVAGLEAKLDAAEVAEHLKEEEERKPSTVYSFFSKCCDGFCELFPCYRRSRASPSPPAPPQPDPQPLLTEQDHRWEEERGPSPGPLTEEVVHPRMSAGPQQPQQVQQQPEHVAVQPDPRIARQPQQIQQQPRQPEHVAVQPDPRIARQPQQVQAQQPQGGSVRQQQQRGVVQTKGAGGAPANIEVRMMN